MATFIKGNAVANATSYELLEKAGDGSYSSVANNTEINFELEPLNLAAGDHTLVVKAKADGYEDSDYSNEVVFTVPLGAYWISEKLTGEQVGSGSASSMLNTQYFYIDDETYLAELTGKTVEAIAICTGQKEASGSIILSLVPLDNTLPSQWQDQITIPFSNTAETMSTIQTIELETTFVVPTGYTLGYRATKGNILGGGTVTGSYKRNDKYYNSNTSETTSSIALGGFDCKVI